MPEAEFEVNGVMGCPACQGTHYQTLGRKRSYVLWRCSECGSIFTDSRAISGELRELYDNYYDPQLNIAPPVVEASLRALALSLVPFRRTGRWLDIGFGEGGLLEIAEDEGWQCYGVEVAPQALAKGARRGWAVTADAETDSRFPLRGFDVVTMIEFIEHVPAPAHFIGLAARLLRPGGGLYLTTPNIESANYRCLGLDWSVVSPPEHLTLWTANGMRRALAQADFEVQQILTEGFNPSDLYARWWPRVEGGAGGRDRNQVGVALNATFFRSPWRRALKAYINRGLSALRAGDTLKVWGVRKAYVLQEDA